VSEVVALDHVSMVYGGPPVLEDVTFTIDGGDFVGIIGPNGSGKTTLIRLMLGLASPTSGNIRLFGVAPTAFREWHRIGYVPQRATFDASLPVRVDEVVATGLVSRTRGSGRGAARRTRIADALAQVGMTNRGADRVGVLSIGQQQRVLIARALVSDPEVLILDEPTGGIDPETQTSFYTLLQQLNRERGVTLVLVSHDIGVVTREVTKLVCLNHRVVFCGGPRDYFSDDAAITALYGSPVRVIGHGHEPHG
jgi:zinc transport system ATP-binding protein